MSSIEDLEIAQIAQIVRERLAAPESEDVGLDEACRELGLDPEAMRARVRSGAPRLNIATA